MDGSNIYGVNCEEAESVRDREGNLGLLRVVPLPVRRSDRMPISPPVAPGSFCRSPRPSVKPCFLFADFRDNENPSMYSTSIAWCLVIKFFWQGRRIVRALSQWRTYVKGVNYLNYIVNTNLLSRHSSAWLVTQSSFPANVWWLGRSVWRGWQDLRMRVDFLNRFWREWQTSLSVSLTLMSRKSLEVSFNDSVKTFCEWVFRQF